ncbi:MAG: zinc-dependent metalloprotease [Verrucomicrobiota bacterium]
MVIPLLVGKACSPSSSRALPEGSSIGFRVLPRISPRIVGCLGTILLLALIGLLPGRASAQSTNAPAPSPAPPPKFRDFNEVTRGLERFDGFFTLYRTNDTLYGEIKAQQLEQPVIAPIAIARGLASAGQPLNFGDEWILVFRRVGDRVQLLRRNIHYKAPDNTPLQKAVKQNYTDSVLLSLPIVTINPAGQGLLVDFGQIFLTDFAQLGIGSLDRSRSTWAKIKTFPNNIELQVEATFSGRSYFSSLGYSDDGVADARGITLVIHYSLAKLPDSGYKPRVADNRVGYFLNATKDFGSSDPDTTFVRYVNRWRLEKSDPKAKLSPPKKQIIWWVEDNVPQEFRPYVEDGILEWNKAFEKIGFRNAIAVRWQNERDEFDPEDINYCTFRWITTSSTFAMSALRSNPLTGEMIDGDVIFDASWIRYWKNEYAYLVGSPAVAGANGGSASILGVGEIISPIMAAKNGYGLPFPLPGSASRMANGSRTEEGLTVELVPSDSTPLQMTLRRRLAPSKFGTCQFSSMRLSQYSLAAMALAQPGSTNDSGPKLPEEFLGQAIKEVVMHEVGHSLGLRHNFKASTMLPYEQINDTSITHVKGLSGSVMDYNPINIAPKGQKQGDFASTTIGPYDYWAIEYAYKPVDGDEKGELTKIAARSPEPDLTFGTDEDMYLSDDPRINVYDLGSDPMQFGKDRMGLALDLLKDLDQRVVKDGESWARLRSAFSVLLGQFGDATYLAAGYIGGQYVSRDFKGGAGSRDPVVPVPGDKQREALQFLSENILSDKAFKFSPALLRRLATEHWYHWGSDAFSYYSGGVDYPIYSRVLALQRIVLNQCFSPTILSRLQNQELQAEVKTKPVKLEEIFTTLTESIWSELNDNTTCYSTIRRNLQREHLRRLMTMVVGNRRSSLDELYGYIIILGGSGTVPADARSLARMHLVDLNSRMSRILETKSGMLDDSTRAHLIECKQRIGKTLDSSYTANEL